MSREIVNPIEDRVLARLQYYKDNGPHFQFVLDQIRLGPRKQFDVVSVHPIAVHCFAVPFKRGREKAARESVYRATVVVGVEGGHMDDEEGRRQFNQTLDDIGEIVDELEQSARWQERAGTYGVTTKIAASEGVNFQTNEEVLGLDTFLWYGRAVFNLVGYVRWGST